MRLFVRADRLRTLATTAFVLWAAAADSIPPSAQMPVQVPADRVPGIQAPAVKVIGEGPGFVRLARTTDRLDATGHRALVGIPLSGLPSLQIADAPASQQAAARLGRVGFFRDQRVVEVLFTPCAEANSAPVVVDLSFDATTKRVPIPRASFYEDLTYRGAILNHDQSLIWRHGPQAAKRASSSQDSGLVGPAFKVTIQKEGIYRLTGEELMAAGAPASIRVSSIALYNGGGQRLSEVGEPAVQLRPVSFHLEDGGDGLLDADDHLLFYGQSTDRWIADPDGERRFLTNPFTGSNVYWVSIGAGVPTDSETIDGSLVGDPAIHMTYTAREHYELQRAPLNIAPGNIPSGKEWYWELLQPGVPQTLDVSLSDAASTVVTLRVGVTTHALGDARVQLLWDTRVVATSSLPRDELTVLQDTIEVEGGAGQLEVRALGDSTAFLDWYEVEYERHLSTVDGMLIFDGASADRAAYALTGFDTAPRLFDVSDEGLTQITGASFDETAGQLSFQAAATDGMRRYAAVIDSSLMTVSNVQARSLGELRGSGGADYVVITHADFSSAAQDLADWRATDDRHAPAPSVALIDVAQIYDDFSGGLFDPTAIRDFLRHAHQHWSPAPSFVVLFGDGTYDYRNHSGTSPGNWIPPYEDGVSTYDEWYTYVSGDDTLPDMAIGRLSVQTADEAQTVVDKLIDYDRTPELGPWQGRILLVADDTFNADEPHLIETMFTHDSEDLAAQFMPPGLDLEKLYLVEFPFTGRFKPTARDAFVRAFNDGAVLLTWVGHGNSRVFAHEHIFVLPTDLQAIDNSRRLPFVFAAASQMGVFDDPDLDSMPEALVKWPRGGAIGMIAASRIGFHNSNMALARNFHASMFTSGRRFVPVGLALLEAKLATDVFRENERRYTLFGDPLTRLSMPALAIRLVTADTLQALGVERFEGEVVGDDGVLLRGFNGEARVQVFDSVVNRRELRSGEPLVYDQPVATLFRGVVPVVGGRFSGSFAVPKDITYRGGRGRISVYASAAQVAAFGSVDGLVMSGTAPDAQPETDGPDISMGIAGQSFNSGDFVPSKIRLHVTIEDVSGINIAGDVGHEIVLIVDGDRQDVTSKFQSGEDYRVGGFAVDLPSLEEGRHDISIEAWDTHNNWSEKRVTVQVSAAQVIEDALFHPNPTSGAGHFSFALSGPANVRIRVHSVSGRLVDEVSAAGNRGHNQILWEPPVRLAGGSYLYRITAMGDAGMATADGVIQVKR